MNHIDIAQQNEVIDRILKCLQLKQFELADRFELTPMNITKWRKSGIPVKYVTELEQMTGIPRCEIRPDIYDPDDPRERVSMA
jgi:hypothetical protein